MIEHTHPFAGGCKVFRFTLTQTLKTTRIRLVTAIFALILFAGGMALNIILALAQGPSPIQNLYVVNTSDLEGSFAELQESRRFADIQVREDSRNRQELMEALQETDYDAAVFLSQDADGYRIEVVLPVGTRLLKANGEELTEELQRCVEVYKLKKAQVDPQLYSKISAQGISQVIAVGKNAQGSGELQMKIVLPLLVGTVLYGMVMLYGQTIAKTIVAEKTSKLMETLLTYIQPYALVAGKVSAMVVIALAQLTIWVLSILLGLWIGDWIGDVLNPEYVNGMMLALRHIQESGGLSALSVGGVIFSIITLCLGFFMYSVIAGLFNSFAGKPEDLSNTMGIFITISLISWLFACGVPIYAALRGASAAVLIYYIPFTAAFCLPAGILVGNVTVWGALLSTVLMVAATLLFIYLTGKVYRDRVFYRGASPFGILTKNH